MGEREHDTGKILDGIRVIDLTTFVTGGFASLMLANLGAEVIKVERPGVGDANRYAGPPFVEVDDYDGPGRPAAEAGESPYFWTVNYDKRSVELDLKTEEGLEALYDLVDSSDVFLENFRPGTAERLGVGYEDVREHNGGIVYCSISAFGDTGPWSRRSGYDLLIQGLSGIMSVTGEEGGQPVKVGLPATDLITSMWAAFGILGALYRREETGEGERVELGMLEAALPWLTKQAGRAFVGEEPTRMGSKDPVLAPYQSYRTADGYVNVACANQKLWKELCEAIDRPDLLEDPRFSSNGARVEHMDALEAELEETFRERSTEEWLELLAGEHGLPVGPLNTVPEALESEQVEARGTIDEVEHPAMGSVPVVQHPINFSRSETGLDDPPPLLGEDTERVLRELAYTDEEIEELREAGAIPPS
ncbi:CaiB/BaiF CoA transferase family protein [Natrialbaceae archaeon A-gly3]